MLVPIDDVGAIGVVKDLRDTELAVNAWSDGLNMRMTYDGAVHVGGGVKIFPTLPINPYYLQDVTTTEGDTLWVVAGLAKVYMVNGTTIANITRQAAMVDVDYTTAYPCTWTGGYFNGIVVLNNCADVPQMQLPVSATQKLEALTAWPATYRCAAMRAVGPHLVAVNITKGTHKYPYLVKWSHAADPGTAPSTWDETDATALAGEFPLASTGGEIVDLCALGDSALIYKTGSVWRMDPISTNEIWRFSRVIGSDGAMTQNCVVEYEAGKHAVFGRNDCYFFDGEKVQSILTAKLRRWLYNVLDPSYTSRCYTVANPGANEVWFCFPYNGSTVASRAIMWNWTTNTVAIRELPQVAFMKSGVVDASIVGTWDSLSGTWNSLGDVTWNELLNLRANERLLGAVTYTDEIYNFDYGVTEGSAILATHLERRGLGIPFDTQKPPDVTSMKTVFRIWPRISGPVGGVVNIQIGSQMKLTDDPVYQPAQQFEIGVSQTVDVICTGRAFAIKFWADTAIAWKLHGFTLDAKKLGAF